jgi:hypothetical protein
MLPVPRGASRASHLHHRRFESLISTAREIMRGGSASIARGAANMRRWQA